MNNPSLDMERVKALDQQLAESVIQCKRHNIFVHVDSINSKQTVAFCSVDQLRRGLFWRERPSHYLSWQAEVALAPLRRYGITPLITVQYKRSGGEDTPPVGTTSSSSMERKKVNPNRSGADKTRVHDPADPFGWRHALSLSGGPILKSTGTRVTAKSIGRLSEEMPMHTASNLAQR